MIRIPEAILRAIVRQAQEALPNEACGYLAGIDSEVREIYPLTNIDASPEHFSFDPEEQFAALKQARGRGLELIAVYHSHPAAPSRMSAEDLRWANDPALFYLVYSLSEDALKAFRVTATKQVSEVSISLDIPTGQ